MKFPKAGKLFAILLLAAILGIIGGIRLNKNAKPDRTWGWDDPLDVAVTTTESIISKKSPILLVMHQDGHGGWQFLPGGDISSMSPVAVPKDQIETLDPSIRQITDLPIDWQASRSAVDKPWKRSQIDTAE